MKIMLPIALGLAGCQSYNTAVVNAPQQPNLGTALGAPESATTPLPSNPTNQSRPNQAQPLQISSGQQIGQTTLTGLPADFVAANREINAATYMTSLERAVLIQHNELRANPSAYADKYLVPLLSRFNGKLFLDDDLPAGIDAVQTIEGRPAVEEAIAYLRRQQPLPPLRPAQALARSAEDHARDQRSGNTGHASSKGIGLLERISIRGKDLRYVAENISYGPATARRIVNSLLIDDGVADRGHRIALFDRRYRYGGAAFEPHQRFSNVTVIHYADFIRLR